MNCKCIAALATVILVSTSAFADYMGDGFTIPDNSPAGGSSSIVITDPGLVGQGLVVGITFGDPPHTWAGDLIATLTHFDGVNTVTTDLFRRIGKATLISTDFGNPNDLDGTYRFSDSFGTPFWNPLAEDGVIVPGDFRPTTNTFNGSPGAVISLDALFANRTWAGTWTLKIADFATPDSGAVIGWSLGLVPAPGAMALLIAASLIGSRRRRCA